MAKEGEEGEGTRRWTHTKLFLCLAHYPYFPEKRGGRKKALPPKGRQGWAGGLPIPTFFFVLLPFSWNESPEINKFLGCAVRNRVTVVNVLGENLTRKKEGKKESVQVGPPLFFCHPAPAPLSRDPFFLLSLGLLIANPFSPFFLYPVFHDRSSFARKKVLAYLLLGRVCRTHAKQQKVCQVSGDRAAAKKYLCKLKGVCVACPGFTSNLIIFNALSLAFNWQN